MERYCFAVEYLGTNYSGWQRQPDKPSIQQTLEEALKVCLRESVTITGSGRTDTGVHAKCQVAHFDWSADLVPGKVVNSINQLTPDDIFIRRLQKCPNEFHARYSALFREYRYRIIFRPSAHDFQTTWYCPYELDADIFISELKEVEGKHDFLGFSIPRKDGKTTDCHIYSAGLERVENGLEILIRGNRFLHKMVRSIIGACYDVSRKKHFPGLTKSILNGTCTVERTWAPSTGLCLEKVGYEDYEF